MARGLVCVLVVCLLGEAFGAPREPRRRRGYDDNEVDSADANLPSDDNPSKVPLDPSITLPPVTTNYEEKRKEFQTPDPFEDDDDDLEPMQTAPTRGGSNIFSLLNLASGLLGGGGGLLGSSGPNLMLRRMMRELIGLNPQPYPYLIRRQDLEDNVIDIGYTLDLKPPPLKREESEENGSESDSQGSDSDEDNAAEESVEDGDKEDEDKKEDNNNASQQNSASTADDNGDGGNSNDSDYDDEPPGGGDGQGGGILGILAGLSGGEDGQSDLGSLLATVSGIVVNLSGDGFDLNSLIASGLGLFVGLLSEGEENPGEIIASYLLTSLDTITGGGSKNNGAFFGKLLSKLISGTSMGEAPEGSSDESGEPQGMKDSAGFLLSLLMGLSGEMSKGSSDGSS